MGIVYTPGQTIGRGDLDIFLTNSQGNPVNAAEITYALYYVDPGPPESEVLIGSASRVPVNPTVGEYYASLMVPPSAASGTYRIRWTFREFVGSPLQQVVQEFGIVASSAIVPVGYSQAETAMMRSLRMLLRNQCVGEEETVELDVDGERMTVRMDDLWEALSDLSPSRQ